MKSLKKNKNDYLEKQITVIFDQINEDGKIPRKLGMYEKPEDYLQGQKLFDAI